jgi:hypothetical protein
MREQWWLLTFVVTELGCVPNQPRSLTVLSVLELPAVIQLEGPATQTPGSFIVRRDTVQVPG